MKEDHIFNTNQAPDPILGETNRPTNHEGEPNPRSPDTSGNKVELGSDSIAHCDSTPLKPRQIIGKKRLEELDQMLSGRDKKILEAIKKHRFLLTGQVQRLYFTDGSTQAANTRATSRALKKLKEYGLVKPLKRRIGGVRAGSASMIWHLTEPGYRLLTLNDTENAKRSRHSEPSPLFLEHTLAVAECAIQIECICKDSHDLTLTSVDSEPTCWRPFQKDGRIIQLKPDLFAITESTDDDGGKFEDQWFIEVDLGTESTLQVVEKCNTYRSYYFTGIEQQKSELFPLVVWLVPDDKRKQQLATAIRNSIQKDPKMFLVITPHQLEPMLRQYIERDELC